MSFVRPQRAAAPWSDGNWWGQYTESTLLPNMAGAELQLPDVQAGDIAWAVDVGALFVCDDPTPGAAVWSPLGGVAPSPLPSVLVWGAQNLTSTTTPRYLLPGYEGGAAPTSAIELLAPRAGTLSNLFVRHNSANGNGNPVVYTVLVNGVASAVTVSLVSGAVGSASDVANTAAVAQGARISVLATKAVAINNGNVEVTATLELS